MNRLVLSLTLLPALVLATLAILFFTAPEAMAGFAANSIDLQLVNASQVGLTLLLCAVPLLLGSAYLARGATRQAQPHA